MYGDNQLNDKLLGNDPYEENADRNIEKSTSKKYQIHPETKELKIRSKGINKAVVVSVIFILIIYIIRMVD